MDIREIRKTFPHTETDQIYFNHASIGPLTTRVSADINDYISKRSMLLTETFEIYLKASNEAKSKLAKMLNCKSHQIAYCENVGMGLNFLAQGIDWRPGDRIILNNIEFPSNVYPFMKLADQGVEIDFAQARKGKVDVEDYEKLITPKTKLVSISLVQFLTGYRADIKALGELCEKNNIIFCVDAIQGAGVVEIDVEDSRIDFLIGGSHKWLMGLTGASYFYIEDKLLERLDQKSIGWTSVADPWSLLDYDITLRPKADRYQTGTSNAVGTIALNSTLDLFLENGMKNIEREILGNTKYFIESLSNEGFEPILKNVDAVNLGSIITVKFEDGAKVLKELKSKNIIAEIREGLIRFAPHFYNTKEEIDSVVEELIKIIK